MKNIIEKIKNLTLEEINKNLMLIATVSLVFRGSSFTNSYIPNPFEIIFSIILILTFIDFIKNKKIKEFFISIPKNIIIVILLLVFSVLFGWAVSIFIKNIEFNYNMILEFGTFIISILTFLLILFYTRNDKTYIKKYFYALLVPVIYVFFIIFPSLAIYFKLAHDGLFLGFSNNVNIISKILLIPSIFFITKALFEFNNKYLKLIYIILSSFLFTLLLWSNQRGAVLGLFIGVIFVYIVFSYLDFKKMISGFLIIISIFIVGFLFTPSYSNQFVLGRILNTVKIGFVDIKNILNINNEPLEESSRLISNQYRSSETRLKIWPYYFKYSLLNPFGIGPNTHMNTDIIYDGHVNKNLGPHNTYLQFLLWGGILGLFSFLYIIYNILFKELNKGIFKKRDPILVSLIGITLAFLISMIFNDSISMYCFWVILALLLRYKYGSNN